MASVGRTGESIPPSLADAPWRFCWGCLCDWTALRFLCRTGSRRLWAKFPSRMLYCLGQTRAGRTWVLRVALPEFCPIIWCCLTCPGWETDRRASWKSFPQLALWAGGSQRHPWSISRHWHSRTFGLTRHRSRKPVSWFWIRGCPLWVLFFLGISPSAQAKATRTQYCNILWSAQSKRIERVVHLPGRATRGATICASQSGSQRERERQRDRESFSWWGMLWCSGTQFLFRKGPWTNERPSCLCLVWDQKASWRSALRLELGNRIRGSDWGLRLD